MSLNNFQNFDDPILYYPKEIRSQVRNKIRYIDKFHLLTVQERAEIIRKIIKKYNSDQYLKRTNHDFTLYYYLLDYAEKYGERCPYTENDSIYNLIIDNKFLVSYSLDEKGDICVSELTSEDEYDYYMRNITDNVLLFNNFIHYTKDALFDEYYFGIKDQLHIEIKKISNYKGRDWTVLVNNYDRDPVAIVDIQTIEHFNKVMELMNIQFELTNLNYDSIIRYNSK